MENSYSIGNTTIDAEHQKLFQIASEAFKRVPSHEKKRKIADTLNKLFHYFQEHFKNEEKYMESLKYDELENHKAIHVEIIEILSRLIRNSATMGIESIEKNLTDFIEESLVNHILNEDKKILYWIQFLKDSEKAKELKEV